MPRNPNKKQCKATAKSTGKRCKYWAVSGANVCRFHGGLGGAPKKNRNAEKHGLFSKYLPEETMELMEALEQEDQLARLRRNIAIQETQIIRSQAIMHVESKEELVKHLKKVQEGKSGYLEEWEFQYPWDRQGNFLNSLSRAMSTLMNMYKTLEELTRDEEYRLRLEKLKVEIENLNKDGQKGNTTELIKEAVEEIKRRREERVSNEE